MRSNGLNVWVDEATGDRYLYMPGMKKYVRSMTNDKNRPALLVGHCVVCDRVAPLSDGECPDCRH